MRRCLFFWLLACPATSGCPAPPASGDQKNDDEITVAFWNVENLFDKYVDKRAPSADVLLPETVEEKLRLDAEIIRELNADIVGLMEVENRGILRELCESHLSDLGYDYYELSEETDERGIDVALIAKQPFLAYSFAVPGFSRGILAGRFTFEGEPLYVVVNHWKSRFGGGEDQRMACARRVDEIVSTIIPQYEGRPVPVLIGGDFNDNDTDPSVQYLASQGHHNLLDHLSEEDRWTLPYNNRDEQRVEYSGFDHIFANDTLQARNLVVRADVIRPQRMVKTRRLYGELYLWPVEDYSDVLGYSDHFPVVARLKKPGGTPRPTP